MVGPVLGATPFRRASTSTIPLSPFVGACLATPLAPVIPEPIVVVALADFLAFSPLCHLVVLQSKVSNGPGDDFLLVVEHGDADGVCVGNLVIGAR